ncbi:uncharacterized protein [Amphiura filiformis]|uniref:uncharacterized protein n=1 Tax=Amphiura filiformis TaxID=82378 RepID=UPI003B212061
MGAEDSSNTKPEEEPLDIDDSDEEMKQKEEGAEKGTEEDCVVHSEVDKSSEFDQLMRNDWYDKLERIRAFMPQIPSICTQLSRGDIREIQQDYLNTIKGGKIVKSHDEYQQSLFECQHTRMRYVVKCKNRSDWIRSQKELFKKLQLSEEIQAVNLSDENGFTCFLCHLDLKRANLYNQHITCKRHKSNVAGACTTLGKMFIVKPI